MYELLKLYWQTDKIPVTGPHHLPQILGQKSKSNYWGDSLQATNHVYNKIELQFNSFYYPNILIECQCVGVL